MIPNNHTKLHVNKNIQLDQKKKRHAIIFPISLPRGTWQKNKQTTLKILPQAKANQNSTILPLSQNWKFLQNKSNRNERIYRLRPYHDQNIRIDRKKFLQTIFLSNHWNFNVRIKHFDTCYSGRSTREIHLVIYLHTHTHMKKKKHNLTTNTITLKYHKSAV